MQRMDIDAREGDHLMEDADPYNKQKYSTSRSSSRRNSAAYLPTHMDDQTPSSAARKYSPMLTSPPSPYMPGSAQFGGYAPQQQTPQQQQQAQQRQPSARQSPSRQSSYNAPSQGYYASPPSSRPTNPQHLPPLQTPISPDPSRSAAAQLNAAFPQSMRSPRSPRMSVSEGSKGPVPQFTKITNVTELQPRVNSQPPFRRANPEGGFISPLQALTTHLASTYRICNPNFQYESSRNPRRVLTKPSKGVKNDGYDNEDSDYILYVNDILGSEDTNHKNRYLILDVLGQGTFGQVVKCQNLKTQEVVAVKVVKNRTAYFNQSMMEVSVLDLLNSRMDKNDDHHILRLKDTFIHRQHLCLVFELLSVNLYELIKQNQFRGLSTTLVRVFAQQLLNGLCLLSKARLIHCDLKPENILLKKYSAAIDMWSLGCIVVELFLGLPLFPGSSEYNQVSRITEMLGLPPTWMLEVGKQSGEFFEKAHDEYGRRTYRLKSMEQYSREHGTKEQPSKKYFSATTLPEIIKNYPMPRKGMKQQEIDREMQNRVAFIDFVHGLLNINPLERWTPQQARTHPFITQQKYMGPFQPQMQLKSTSSRSPAPGVQQQQQAEALSKQRAQAAHQQQAQQAAAAAQQAQQQFYASQTPSYPGSPISQGSPTAMYTHQPQQMYTPGHVQAAPQPYPTAQQAAYPNPIPVVQPPPAAMHGYGQSAAQQSLYAQATMRSGRQRASTLDMNGIPPALQRVVSHLDPNAPIRLQPSPAYYPPPADGSQGEGLVVAGRRRISRGQKDPNNPQQGRNFVRALEDRTLEEGGWGGAGSGAGAGGGLHQSGTGMGW
ncbi:hypothetical protein ANO11243_095250 [Dothideomycetidae sp. 11243]|nr:hypothetical protein ANO11243_095250 [fungal sp. No.11243]